MKDQDFCNCYSSSSSYSVNEDVWIGNEIYRSTFPICNYCDKRINFKNFTHTVNWLSDKRKIMTNSKSTPLMKSKTNLTTSVDSKEWEKELEKKQSKLAKKLNNLIDLSNEFHPVPKPVGKKKTSKVQQWSSARAKLKKEYSSKGITKCEIDGKTFALSFHHRSKRRDNPGHTFQDTILVCQGCHTTLEYDKKLSNRTFKLLRP